MLCSVVIFSFCQHANCPAQLSVFTQHVIGHYSWSLCAIQNTYLHIFRFFKVICFLWNCAGGCFCSEGTGSFDQFFCLSQAEMKPKIRCQDKKRCQLFTSCRVKAVKLKVICLHSPGFSCFHFFTNSNLQILSVCRYF